MAIKDGATTGGTDRRRELLSVAAGVFAEKGVAHTTVRDIAEEAGILSGSLYHHFESKNQMVAEVLEGGLRQSGEREAAIVAKAADALTAVRQLIEGLVVWVGEHPQVARILTNDKQYIRDTADLVNVEIERQSRLALWVLVVRDGIDQGVFTPEIDPGVSVRAIFDGTLGSVRWLPPIGTDEPVAIGRQLADLYVGGLRGRPGTTAG